MQLHPTHGYHHHHHSSPFVSAVTAQPALFQQALLPLLTGNDKGRLRACARCFRALLNGSVEALQVDGINSLISPSTSASRLSAERLLGARFPNVAKMAFKLSSAQEAKTTTLFLLTQPPSAGAQLTSLTLAENRNAPSLLAQTGVPAGRGSCQPSWRQEPSFTSGQHHYGYTSTALDSYGGGGHRGGGPAAALQTLDLTEVLLAAVCSCTALRSITVDKTALLETEAAAIARLRGLQQLVLSTNSSAQPLRRPLVQLMLSSLMGLRELELSYVRDTTADMAQLLPRLSALTKLAFRYAYWGESGAGERIMGVLAKAREQQGQQLQELRLYECCVSDSMLYSICSITGLRCLLVQDEDAPEESCPTNKGLSRLTQLSRLEHLELFGEELRLDAELLALLARLPNLQQLAVAGLDALQPEAGHAMGHVRSTHPALHAMGAMALGGGRAMGMHMHMADMSDMDMEDADMSSAGEYDGEDEDGGSSSSSGLMDDVTSRPRAASPFDVRTSSHALKQGGPRQQLAGSEQQQQHASSCSLSGASQQDQQQQAGQQQPLQCLHHLVTLRLYGPMSLSLYPPPLALLLPQPRLQHLKLSACASHANVRALAQQSGLTKLTISHTSVHHLYPQPHSAAVGPDMPSCSAGGVAAGGVGGGLKLCASILGFHSEVAAGLAQLRILRIKDLPGFSDCHLADLASVACRLPALAELKLRLLNLVSDNGLAALAGVGQLQRLKLYALGDGVTEPGVAHVAAALPRLAELKVKDCWRVGPTLRETVAACRAAVHGCAAQSPSLLAAAQVVVVRCGQLECSGHRAPVTA